MNNVNISLKVDRHRSNGSAKLQGTAGANSVELSVRRGTSDGNAYVSGYWGDEVDLTFHRDSNQGYNRIEGQLKGRAVDARMSREVGGDTDMTLDRGRFLIDRDQQGEEVDFSGTDLFGAMTRELREGDEQGHYRLDGARIRFEVDRDPKSGDFTISGRTDAGRFELNTRREPRDGDLTITGSVPEGSQMFPLFWEVLGDDKNIPDNNPLYPGSLMGMSMFVDHKTGS